MNTEVLINRTVDFVKEQLANAEGGHDWWHIHRVWKTATTIAEKEPGANLLLVELSALLHDVAYSKFHSGDDTVGPRIAGEFLASQGVDPALIQEVKLIISHISFKGGHNKGNYQSLELSIVQDADRLDAIGAIGMARAFNYGGFKNRPLYDPAQPPNLQKTVEQYKFNNDPTINHFYEKLFLLKDRMNTATGKAMAEQRHAFMEAYVEQFYAESDGHP